MMSAAMTEAFSFRSPTIQQGLSAFMIGVATLSADRGRKDGLVRVWPAPLSVCMKQNKKTLGIPAWDEAKLLERVGTLKPGAPAQPCTRLSPGKTTPINRVSPEDDDHAFHHHPPRRQTNQGSRIGQGIYADRTKG